MLLTFDHAGQSYRDASLDFLAAARVPDDAILSAVKAKLCQDVDTAAETVRLRLLTPGAGQALEYQEAQTQAAAALKSPSSATADKYPMLAVTIGIDVDPSTGAPATDVVGVARSIDAARQAWLAAGAFIRGVRLEAKMKIDAATTMEEAEATFAAVTWEPAPAA